MPASGLLRDLVLVAIALALGLVAFAVSLWAHLRYWVRRLTVPLAYASTEILETPDGSRIELRRLPVPDGVPRSTLPPILMVHGVAANHRNNDLHPDTSLARSLAALGRDVWLLTLRSGRSDMSRTLGRRVRFAAMVKEDVPLGVSGVLARTGASALDYVGFSMGGMLLYAALARTVPVAQIRRAVIVGSPGSMTAPRLLRPLLRLVPRWLVPAGRYKLGAHTVAFASEWLRTPFHHVIINPHNVRAGLTRTALVNMVEDIPAPLHADFLEWAARDGVIRVDGEPVLPALAYVATPALFFAGTADRLAPPSAVEVAYAAWGSAVAGVDKRLVVLGRSYGARADYGHGDLAIGEHVSAELFEPVARFLSAD